MRVGLFLGTQPFGSDDPEDFCVVARRAEEAGFASVWLGDHPVRPALDATTYPYTEDGRPFAANEEALYDPFPTLAYVAAATERVVLGTAVYVLPLRHPLVTARGVACLDRISKGRVALGVGVGWHEQEFEALGVDWRLRGRLMDEAISLVRRLWTEDVVESDSELYPFGPVILRPRPVQQPHPPILVGGQTPVAIRRAARLGDGWIPVAPSLAELRGMLAVLDEELTRYSRSRESFTVNVRCPVAPTQELLHEYAALGVDEVRVHAAHLAGLPRADARTDDVLAAIERFAPLLSHLRAIC